MLYREKRQWFAKKGFKVWVVMLIQLLIFHNPYLFIATAILVIVALLWWRKD